MEQEKSILQLRDISKRFGGLQALDNVDLSVTRGAIHGIIGPNGAGKTTLFNVITGLVKPDRGEIRFEGKTLPYSAPHRLVPLGICRTFQNIRIFKEMTVEDNVLIGQHVHTPTPILSILAGRKHAREWEWKAREVAAHALQMMGLESKSEELAKNLPYGQQKLVEFARALAAQPKVVLLDEPAAGLNPAEKSNLLKIMATLREKGYTIVFIEHDMKLVMNICDTISVLDHGKKIAEGEPKNVRNHPDVIKAYLGKGGVLRA